MEFLLASSMGWPLGHHPAGMSPRQATYFLCFAKESRQRKATPAPQPLLRRGPLRCSEPGAGGAERTAFASLSPFERPRRARSESRTACAGPSLLRFSAAPRGPHTQQPTAKYRTARVATVGAPFPGCWLSGCSPSEAAEQRSGLGRARSALPLLDQGGRSNGESEANAVRSALQPQDASSAGNPRPQAGDSGVGACSLPTFLHEQESRSAAGRNSRRAAPQSTS